MEVSERNKNSLSGIELVSAEWTFMRLFCPLLNAASVVDVLTGQLLYQLFLFEPLHADGAHSRTFLHYQCLHPPSLSLHLVHEQAGQ